MQFGSRENQKNFAATPTVTKPRSVFNRSFESHDTYQFDYLNVFFTDIMFPGDTVKLDTKIFARLTTQLKPVMTRMYASVEYFWIPDRLVWDNQQRFMGEQVNPDDSTDFVNPQMTSPNDGTGFASATLFDQMGLPVGVPNYLVRNVKPLRAYLKCWNDWYRDQNLQDSVDVPTDDGPDTVSDYAILKRNKAHDYFTSMLPWTQKGDPVAMPLGTLAPLLVNPDAPPINAGLIRSAATKNLLGATGLTSDAGGQLNTDAGTTASFYDPNGTLFTDLSEAASATINQLRESFLMQQYLEQLARGGSRYPELISQEFGAHFPEAIYRPEYLGGGHFDLNVMPIAQQSESGSTPQGNLAAMATLNVRSEDRLGFTKSFNEWGTVLGLITFRAAISYQQGANRFWDYSTRFDYPLPSFAGLGEQGVKQREIFAEGVLDDDDQIIGYQERFAEAKYRPSEIKGLLRSNPTFGGSLDVYHLAEQFITPPTLNAQFIESSTPIDRILAIDSTEAPPIIADFYHEYIHTRVLPVHSIPARLGF